MPPVQGTASLIALAVLVLAGTARAQAPATGELAVAREQFQRGAEAARAGRWAEALPAFQRSYALVPNVVTLLNLAGAQSQTGLLVDGTESYRRYLREATDPRDATLREQARQALSAAEARLAHLRLSVPGLQPGDRVLLDARPIPVALLDVEMPVDPGPHHVAIQRDGQEVARADLALEEHESLTTTLAAPPPASATPHPLRTANVTAPASGGILRSPWFWAAVGVLVAGGVSAGVVAGLQGGTSPYVGSLPPGSFTLR